jgi:hypothetical protein
MCLNLIFSVYVLALFIFNNNKKHQIDHLEIKIII